MRFIARDLNEYGMVMVAILEFARTEPEEFTFGPFVEDEIVADGIAVEPPVPRLTALVRQQFPGVVTRDA